MLDDLDVSEAGIPLISAWNKIDAADDPEALKTLAGGRSNVVAISGATGEGLGELMKIIGRTLEEQMTEMEVGGGGGRAFGGWGGPGGALGEGPEKRMEMIGRTLEGHMTEMEVGGEGREGFWGGGFLWGGGRACRGLRGGP